MGLRWHQSSWLHTQREVPVSVPAAPSASRQGSPVPRSALLGALLRALAAGSLLGAACQDCLGAAVFILSKPLAGGPGTAVPFPLCFACCWQS